MGYPRLPAARSVAHLPDPHRHSAYVGILADRPNLTTLLAASRQTGAFAPSSRDAGIVLMRGVKLGDGGRQDISLMRPLEQRQRLLHLASGDRNGRPQLFHGL